MSNVGSVVECSPATRAARVRFPDVASFLLFFLHILYQTDAHVNFQVWLVGESIKKIIQINNMFLTQNFTQVTNIWQLWDSNPRPFGLVPKTSALDHSAKLPLYWTDFHIASFKQLWSKKISPTDCNLSFVRKICFFNMKKYQSDQQKIHRQFNLAYSSLRSAVGSASVS